MKRPSPQLVTHELLEFNKYVLLTQVRQLLIAPLQVLQFYVQTWHSPVIPTYPKGQGVIQVELNRNLPATHDEQVVNDEHSKHGGTHAEHWELLSLAYVKLGQIYWHPLFHRYTLGINVVRHELQLVWLIEQVAHGELQAKQTLATDMVPELQLATHLLFCKLPLVQLVQLVIVTEQVAQVLLQSVATPEILT